MASVSVNRCILLMVIGKITHLYSYSQRTSESTELAVVAATEVEEKKEVVVVATSNEAIS